MQPAEPKSILCVGRLYCDLIFTGLPRMPTMGTEVFSEGLGIQAGGGAAITAAHLAALGHRSELAAFRPAAPLGDVVLEALAEAGVGLGLCRGEATGAPQLTVALVHQGERAFVTHQSGPACPTTSASDIARLGVRHIHVGELTTLIECPEILTLAREAGLTLSLDCSWADDLDPTQVAQIIPQVDVFLPNEAEARMLQGFGISAPFAPLTVIKEGAGGATAITAETSIHAPAKPTQVIDTTGAGDAFNAGFLSGWVFGKPVEACLEKGNTQGARAVVCLGGLPEVPLAPVSAEAVSG